MNTPESKIPNRSNGGRFVYDKKGNFVSHTPCTKAASAQAAQPDAAKPDAAAAPAETSAGKRPK